MEDSDEEGAGPLGAQQVCVCVCVCCWSLQRARRAGLLLMVVAQA